MANFDLSLNCTFFLLLFFPAEMKVVELGILRRTYFFFLLLLILFL